LWHYALEQLSPTEVELEALFVRPFFIGKGYGRALMEHAKHKAAEMGATSLIIQGDPNAERFYQAAGGKLVGKRKSESIRGRLLPVFEIDLA
jgi:GNAT superfamily N-acetyltransferase